MELDTKKLASPAMLWRLNTLGLLDLLDEPGEPLERAPLKEVLALAAAQGLWQPAARGQRGVVRWDSADF
jgi:hypothetical protein